MADLDVIPGGRGDAQAVARSAKQRLPWLISRLKLAYDYIVIDAAPLCRSPTRC